MIGDGPRINAAELDFGEIHVNRGGGESVQGFHKDYRNSGLGGEDGKYGFEAYVESKTMYMQHS
ncbi:hypothetical protein [Salinicola halimionae]|uniref:hypothetical protein n=1 Tax=Salinicola halimionae TaxID=1949081 RepID=UPI001CB6B9FA|nr:hypothetical protein [Salinicola halimionae]